MGQGGLQGVDARELAWLHTAALRLSEEARRQQLGGWRDGLDARAGALATLAATALNTRLMEAMNWLLTAQAVAANELADPGPAAWRALPWAAPPDGELAVAVDRLYRRIVQLDAEAR